ncbi:transposase (plasmid) [Frondihabitans sp. PAMC 28766]|uniref:IS110 family transposase n=1 Tax=Frondihabitans sp. PAMC 28766 TaxID=1795630 RepID=UPI00078B2C2D|nr:IS110 family transposase [Frondihabitans sp. PAMC 28766]AMM22727.1 transposase [Frondihabitans sp. PAMC 28766]
MSPTIIGIDPHKESWTAVAVDPRGQRLAALRAPVTRTGYRQLRRFADRYPEPVWAIEGAYGLGAPLSALLAEDGVTAWDVPAKLAARVRVLSTGHGRKSDEDDALSVAVAATTSTRLRPVRADAASTELKLLTEHRDDLVRTRTQTVNRLHAIMTLLVIGGAPRSLTADTAATLLRRVHPAESVTMTRRLIAVDLVAEIRRLDKRISTATEHITTQVTRAETTLTVIPGIGQLTAGKILARTGPVTRFANEAHFAAYAGVAPREVSSGDVIRHRLNRGGDRQLNYALHVIALTQISMKSSPGRVFYDRKRTEGKSGKEALRALKRRLATVVFRILLADHARVAAGPAGQSGTTLKSSATGSHPDTSSSDKSLTGPTTNELIYVTT